MKKKIALLMIALFTMAVMAGCGKNDATADGSQNVTESVTESTVDTGNDQSSDTTVEELENGNSFVGETIAQALLKAFEAETENSGDVEAIATALSENEAVSEVGMVVMTVEEGYLNGFDAEISGFTQGAYFAPMIGSIPFVGYVFETETPDELVETLDSHAMLNWNICTVADEKVVSANGNLVFFVMAPYTFEQ